MRVGLLLALALIGCAPHEPAQRTDDTAPTIVSLNPCTDAILAEIADPSQVLAISHYSHEPKATSMALASARQFRATGGTVEEVLALDPDIVVGSVFMPPATRNALQDLGVQVEAFGIAGSIAESVEQIRSLARLAGHPARGDALIAQIEAALKESDARAGQSIHAVLWQPGGIVPGRDALVTDLLARTGLVSDTLAQGLGQADYLALEQVVAAPPDVLLVAGSEAGQRHPVLDRIPGLRREHFDTNLLYCGGPTIIRAAERLAQIRDGLGS